VSHTLISSKGTQLKIDFAFIIIAVKALFNYFLRLWLRDGSGVQNNKISANADYTRLPVLNFML